MLTLKGKVANYKAANHLPIYYFKIKNIVGIILHLIKYSVDPKAFIVPIKKMTSHWPTIGQYCMTLCL